MMATVDDVRFHEVQRVPHRRLWAFAALLTGPAVLIIAPLVITVSLTTQVRSDGVFYRFRPFNRRFRRIDFEDIIAVEPVRFALWAYLLEYGGWGIRVSMRGRGLAFTVWGRSGVRVTMSDGTRRLLGSRRPTELAEAIDAVRKAA